MGDIYHADKFLHFLRIKHAYQDNSKGFDKETSLLTTCNQFNPAQYNPDIFQSVEQPDEEVRDIVVSSETLWGG